MEWSRGGGVVRWLGTRCVSTFCSHLRRTSTLNEPPPVHLVQGDEEGFELPGLVDSMLKNIHV